jgi:hypothetical protein
MRLTLAHDSLSGTKTKSYCRHMDMIAHARQDKDGINIQ